MPLKWKIFRDFCALGIQIGPFNGCSNLELKAQLDLKKNDACCTGPENGKNLTSFPYSVPFSRIMIPGPLEIDAGMFLGASSGHFLLI